MYATDVHNPNTDSPKGSMTTELFFIVAVTTHNANVSVSEERDIITCRGAMEAMPVMVRIF